MNIIELKRKNYTELQKILSSFLHEQFKYRIAMSSGEFTKIHLLKKVRRNIAKVNTVISEIKLKQGIL